MRIKRLTVWLGILFACASLAVPFSAARNKKGSPVMQIKFSRSGGFAGAATNVSGVVDLGDQGAHVKADAYQRDLRVPEAQQLRTAADPAKLTRLKQALASPPQARDAYQYDVTVVTKDGKSQTFTIGGGADPEALRGAAPEAAHLLDWVENESQKIWEHRVSSRRQNAR
jgi:hypothetical protein